MRNPATNRTLVTPLLACLLLASSCADDVDNIDNESRGIDTESVSRCGGGKDSGEEVSIH